MSKVLITGGSGFLGREISQTLSKANYEVAWLTRNPKKTHPFLSYKWDIESNSIDIKAFDGVKHIIHLAGEGIANKRWTPKRKRELYESRINSTQFLFDTFKTLKTPIKTFVATSAVGYYGAVTVDKIFTEKDTPYDDFISNLCVEWEKTISNFEALNIRTVIYRTGIVLAKNGGALQKMKTPVVTPLGTGKQFMPWIHISDYTNLYLKAITDINLEGIYNAVAPEQITNYTFLKLLAKAYKLPFIPVGIPKFVLKLILGEMVSILVEGSKVSSNKIKKAGYQFKYTTLYNALKNL